MFIIVLSVFAVLGIILLCSLLLDALYYRKCCYELPLLVDLRSSGIEEAWRTLEAIALARKTPGSKAILNTIYLLISKDNPAVTEEMAYHYLRIFDLPGTVFTEDEAWYSDYQKTPAKEGTNP